MSDDPCNFPNSSHLSLAVFVPFVFQSSELDIHFAVGSALADCVQGERSMDPHKLWFKEKAPQNTEEEGQEVGGDSMQKVEVGHFLKILIYS